MEDHYVSLSALQHYAYCTRQCALIHVEQVWSENFLTAEGRMLHEKVDSGIAESRGNLRVERSVNVISHNLRLTGKLDLLEINSGKYRPVEYKRGKPKIQDWDRVQLCAQVLCLEEMLKIEISEAALWYWQVRHRENIAIDENLRERTLEVITKTHELLKTGKTPPAIYNAKLCKSCSLLEICGVHQMKRDHSRQFIEELFLS